jgi:hypothetical protein
VGARPAAQGDRALALRVSTGALSSRVTFLLLDFVRDPFPLKVVLFSLEEISDEIVRNAYF